MTTLPPEGQDGQQPETPAPSETPSAPEPPAAPQPPAAEQPPAAPQYAAPPQPEQPQYAAPGQTPPPGGHQQPPAGYAQPVADPVSNITLNYWLSVFFTWIPALIFFLIEKDKGDRRAYEYHRDNLNFSLARIIAGVAAYILLLIPYLGWVLFVLIWIGEIVLFVFHIIAAAKAAAAFRSGQPAPFIFNVPMVK